MPSRTILGFGSGPASKVLSVSGALDALVRSGQTYLFSLDSVSALALFTVAAVALFSHKVVIILLHQPLSTCGLVLASPFLFTFDLMTLILLHRGLSSSRAAWRMLAGVTSILLAICSAAFASLYFQGNAELQWAQSVEVTSCFTEADI
jgi:hypothetical protein